MFLLPAGNKVTSKNSALVIAGWHDLGAASMQEAVYIAHTELLSDRKSINAMVRVQYSGTDNSVHIIGSRYSQSRGRYIATSRTTNDVYHFRVTDTGLVYGKLQSVDEQVYTP